MRGRSDLPLNKGMPKNLIPRWFSIMTSNACSTSVSSSGEPGKKASNPSVLKLFCFSNTTNCPRLDIILCTSFTCRKGELRKGVVGEAPKKKEPLISAVQTASERNSVRKKMTWPENENFEMGGVVARDDQNPH